MILKIERIRDSRRVRLRLSGEFRSHHLYQVKAEISRGEPIALDLEEVDLVALRSNSVPQCPRGRRYLGVALLDLYPGMDVEGAARRENSNGLAMRTSLKGTRNDD